MPRQVALLAGYNEASPLTHRIGAAVHIIARTPHRRARREVTRARRKVTTACRASWPCSRLRHAEGQGWSWMPRPGLIAQLRCGGPTAMILHEWVWSCGCMHDDDAQDPACRSSEGAMSSTRRIRGCRGPGARDGSRRRRVRTRDVRRTRVWRAYSL
jgi:Ser/Thr protein kinase RdoA (MazF antagonist)